jgi:hypothetical protein
MKRTPLVTTIQSALFITDNPETIGSLVLSFGGNAITKGSIAY